MSKNKNEGYVASVTFLELNENIEKDQLNEIDYDNLNLLNNKPLLLDLPLPRLKSDFLNNSKDDCFEVSKKNNYKYLSGELNGIKYEGKLRLNDFNPSVNYVGVLNKQKRKMTFIPIDKINVDYKIKEIYKDSDQNPEQANTSNINKSYITNKSLLVQDFGTNKSRKVVDQIMTNVVKEENISSVQAMQNIIQLKGKNSIKQNLENDNNSNSYIGILPEFDINATDLNAMFNIKSSK